MTVTKSRKERLTLTGCFNGRWVPGLRGDSHMKGGILENTLLLLAFLLLSSLWSKIGAFLTLSHERPSPGVLGYHGASTNSPRIEYYPHG